MLALGVLIFGVVITTGVAGGAGVFLEVGTSLAWTGGTSARINSAMASVIQVQYLVHQLEVGRFGLFQKNSKVVAQKVASSLDKSLYATFINISHQCSGTI